MSEREEWIKTTYLGHLGSLIDTNMTYLHSTVGWAMALLLGGVLFVASRPQFPDHVGFLLLLLLLLVLAHFAVRTSKAYLNVIRWTTLEKYVVRGALAEQEDADWDDVRTKIVDYHGNWASPLSYGDIVHKLVFELGFGYFFVAIGGLLVYTVVTIGRDLIWVLFLEFLLAFGILSVEVWMGLVRSGYMRSLRPDWLARRDR